MMRDAWSSDFNLPTPDTDDAYCLVFSGRARLHIVDRTAPTRYRPGIAAATGIPLQSLRLYAAQPPPADVSEKGVPCNTVIAAFDSVKAPAEVWHGIILDCRHILEDWQEHFAPDGRLDVGQVLHTFRESTPPGWCPTLSVAGHHATTAFVRPGQVVAVTYVPQDQGQSSSAAPGQEHQAEPFPAASADDSTPPSPRSTVHEDVDMDPQTEPTNEIVDSVSISVYVYSEQYTPEHCRIALPSPPTIPDVIGAVEQVRHPVAHCIFPDLIPVCQ